MLIDLRTIAIARNSQHLARMSLCESEIMFDFRWFAEIGEITANDNQIGVWLLS